MKKTNKAVALLLAATMTLGMAFSAFADNTSGDSSDDGAGTTTTTTYTDMSTVTIHKTYEATNTGTTSPAEEFKFTISNTSVTDAASGVTTANMPTPTVGSVSYSAGDAGSANKTKDITVTLPTYESVGVYTYTISETAGSTAGVTYRTSDIKLVVTVIEQSGLVRVAAIHTEGKDGTKSDTFSDNTYSAGSLAVSKTVSGIMGDKTKYFPFTINLTGDTTKTYAASYAITTNSTNSQNATSVSVNGDSVTVYLKDGDNLSIANLPYGVSYTVTEGDNSGYTVNSVVTDSTGEKGKIDSASESVAFTNTKGGIVDTGIILDNAPYVILAAVAVFGLAMVVTRKHNIEQ